MPISDAPQEGSESLDTSNHTASRVKRNRSLKWGLLGLSALLTVSWILVRGVLVTAPARGESGAVDRIRDEKAPSAAASDTTAAAVDETMGERIVGRWKRDYSGEWQLEIRADGTGTMTVVPDAIWALIVGSQVTIEMRWQVVNGFAIFDTLSGKPESSFNIVMKMWKPHQERRIIELTESQFVYLSDDGHTRSEWRRAAPH